MPRWRGRNNGAVVASGIRLPGTARLQTTLQASYSFAGPMDTARTRRMVPNEDLPVR